MHIDGSPNIAAPIGRAVAKLFAWARRRPWLMLFLVLVVAFTLIGSNSVSAKSVRIDDTSGQSADWSGPAGLSNPSASPSIGLPEIYVHVVGEVVAPGLYELPAESRLVDAIALAGGFTRRAEQSSVNLARVLADAEQLVVLPRGASVATGVGLGASVGATAGGKISLNRSSQSQLEELPRVGPALAGRIIDWRTANGGFRSIDDLLKISGFGDKMFAAIKGMVTL